MIDERQTPITPDDTKKKKDYSLKGSFVSVLLLGFFIIISWAGVYAIFIMR